jgi:hypothetical protein
MIFKIKIAVFRLIKDGKHLLDYRQRDIFQESL